MGPHFFTLWTSSYTRIKSHSHGAEPAWSQGLLIQPEVCNNCSINCSWVGKPVWLGRLWYSRENKSLVIARLLYELDFLQVSYGQARQRRVLSDCLLSLLRQKRKRDQCKRDDFRISHPEICVHKIFWQSIPWSSGAKFLHGIYQAETWVHLERAEGFWYSLSQLHIHWTDNLADIVTLTYSKAIRFAEF